MAGSKRQFARGGYVTRSQARWDNGILRGSSKHTMPKIRTRLAPQVSDVAVGASQRERLSMTGDIMSDTILAYLISLGLIGTGVIWVVAGTNSTTSALSVATGVLTIAVGLISLLNEFHHRAYWR
jgi:hypothetical protein